MRADPGDGLQLDGRDHPQRGQMPAAAEQDAAGRGSNCRPFLLEAIASLPRLTTFIALGKVAHDSLCRSFGVPLAAAKFAPRRGACAARRRCA